MKYDDLIGAPYKAHGRGNGGYDCYGLVIECCRRNGKTLKDPFQNLERLESGAELPYMDAVNVREVAKPHAGCIVECLTCNNLHTGYMVSDTLVLHTTKSNGARVTHIRAVNPIKYYEVTE